MQLLQTANQLLMVILFFAAGAAVGCKPAADGFLGFFLQELLHTADQLLMFLFFLLQELKQEADQLLMVFLGFFFLQELVQAADQLLMVFVNFSAGAAAGCTSAAQVFHVCFCCSCCKLQTSC